MRRDNVTDASCSWPKSKSKVHLCSIDCLCLPFVPQPLSLTVKMRRPEETIVSYFVLTIQTDSILFFTLNTSNAQVKTLRCTWKIYTNTTSRFLCCLNHLLRFRMKQHVVLVLLLCIQSVKYIWSYRLSRRGHLRHDVNDLPEEHMNVV